MNTPLIFWTPWVLSVPHLVDNLVKMDKRGRNIMYERWLQSLLAFINPY